MKNQLKIWTNFIKYIRSFWKQQVFLFFLLVITNVAPLASPYVLKIIIDEVFPKGNLELLYKIILILLAIYAVRVSVRFLADYVHAWVSSRIMAKLTQDIYSHVLRLPISFYRQYSVGDLLNRITSEVSQVQSALTGTFAILINHLIAITALITMMCILEWKLLFAIIFLYPVTVFILKRYDSKIFAVVKKIHEKESLLVGYFGERFANIKAVKASNAFDYEDKNASVQLKGLVDLNVNATLLSSKSRNLSLFVLTLVPIVTLAIGGWEVIHKTITIGTLIAFLQYTNKLHEPFQGVVALYVDVIRTSVSLQRIFEILSHSKDPEMELDGPLFSIHNIELKNIGKTIEGKTIIDEVSMTFESGRNYAIVGPNGSGKSSLVNLLTKQDSFNKGCIQIDGKDFLKIGQRAWTKKIGVVFQSPMIFNCSIERNVKYGNFNATTSQVIAALTEVGYEFSGSPEEAIKHEIGDPSARRLSGGQMQKVMLARELLQEREILILDECLAEFDALSLEKVLSNLKNNPRIKSIILVAHSLNLLSFVDEIFYINNGRVVEKGSLTDLINMKGKFYHLFENQIKSSRSVVFS